MSAIHTDVLIIGAGPAGMAAALRSHECGARVTVIDDNPGPGGQIWRGGKRNAWFRRLEATRVSVIPNAQVIAGASGDRRISVETPDAALEYSFDKLIIATGARELFIPFPNWTLPGIAGVGGLQALVKSGMPIRGKKVVIAGTGPLLLAVAAHLRKAGAQIVLIAEQAKQRAVQTFAWQLLQHPAKVAQAAALRITLTGVPYRFGCWVEAAEGNDRLERLCIRQGSRTWLEECDLAGIAFGLYPNTELATVMGCRLNETAIAVDQWQRTSVDGVFAAGECTGIGGVDLAILEGEIAGCAACNRLDRVAMRSGSRNRVRRFAAAMNRTFAPRPELRSLPQADTIVCRCEDVTYGKLRTASSFRGAKLQMRCGMGPCQGRICGASTDFLFGWRTDSIRPPVYPARIGSLVADSAIAAETK